jgi:putative tryptophan/tyrosine transport system substrate-binding protein
VTQTKRPPANPGRFRPLAASGQQQPGKLPTIGFLGAATPSGWAPYTAAFAAGMRQLGWIEGRTVAIEYRWAEGRPDRYAEIAAEFVRRKVDVSDILKP